MGDAVNGRNEKAGIIVEPTEGTGTGNSSKSSNTETSRTASGSGGSGRSGGSGGSGGSGRSETVISTEGSELAVLNSEELEKYKTADDKEKKRLLRNAKRRADYAKNKNENGQTVRPKKVNKKKDTVPSNDITQLNGIIVALSSVVASRPNCQHWQLSEKEVESITTPLAKMLAESETFQNVGQYSNQIALVMACITVFVPRLVATVQINKEVKKIERTGQKTDTSVIDRRIADSGKAKAEDRKTDRRNNKQPSGDGTGNGQSLPWYGDPIC